MASKARITNNGKSSLDSNRGSNLAAKCVQPAFPSPLDLLDHAQVAVIALDMQDAVTYWNRYAEKLYGWSREEALGRNARDMLVMPSDNDLARSIMAELSATGSWEGKVTVGRKDGTTFSAHVVDTVIRDEDDNAVGFVGVSIDVTERAQERAALEESEARLRSAADLAGLAPYEWNPRTGALLWDDGVKKMWSLPLESHPNIDTFLAGIHPGDRARVDAAVAMCCDPAGDGLFSEEYRVIGQRDRQQRWIASRGKTFFENGVAVQHVGVAQDITERKRAEEAQSFLASIVESSDDAIISTDLNGTIVSWNAGAERLFGYTAAEVEGRPVSILVPPDRFEEIDELWGFLMIEQRVNRFDTVCMRKNGTQVDISLSIWLIKDNQDHVIAASSIARDITERKQAEEALRESEVSFRTMFADNPLPMWVYDQDTLQFLQINDAAIEKYGYTRDEFLSMRITEIRPPEEVALMLERIGLTQTGRRISEGMRHRTKDGQVLDVDITSHTFSFVGRKATLVVVVDVTERKAYQTRLEADAAAQMDLLRQLMAAEEAERRRLSMEIHDGPLQSLGVALMALDRARRRRERGEDELADRELSSLRSTMGGTVADLRAILGDLSLEVLTSRGLEAALRGHIERYVEITGKSITLDYGIPRKLPPQLKLLFYRLAQESLANIRKHSQAERVIVRLDMSADEQTVWMTVIDDGVGFDVSQVLDEHTDGTKIGLRSMRERIRAAQGDLEIESAPSQGTTLRFYCSIPAHEPTISHLPDLSMLPVLPRPRRLD